MGEENLSELSVYIGAVVAAVIYGFNWIRKAAKNVSADVPEFKEHRAHGELIDRLREEVGRLEVIINKMQGRIEHLETRIESSSTKMSQVRAEALGIYTTLAKTQCSCLDSHKAVMTEAVLRIINLPEH